MKHLMKHLKKLTAPAAIALVAALTLTPSHAMPTKRAICDSNNAHCAHNAANVDVWLFTLLMPDPKPVAKPAVAQVQVASVQASVKKPSGWPKICMNKQFHWIPCSWLASAPAEKPVGDSVGQGGYSLSYDGATYASAHTLLGDSATVAVLRDATLQQGEAK